MSALSNLFLLYILIGETNCHIQRREQCLTQVRALGQEELTERSEALYYFVRLLRQITNEAMILHKSAHASTIT
jgi:hypothetical protein